MSVCKNCIYYDICEFEYYIGCVLDDVNFDDGNKDDICVIRNEDV